jgi:hypothetical protein
MLTVTIMTFTSFILMNNIGEADARTLYKDPDCSTIDSKSAGECKINVNFGGDCASSTYASSAKCNVNVDINRGTFNPSGDNELKLKYFIDSAIYCSPGGTGWSKSTCLANAVNNYNAGTPSININTDNRFDLLDIEATYDSDQKISTTTANNYFKANNDLKQQVNVYTRGYDTEVDMEGSGADGLFLKSNQLISDVDNTNADNKARQQFDVTAKSGGDILLTHNEYGFAGDQQIINTDGRETATTTTTDRLTALNQYKQTLTADVEDYGDIEYDTYGLSTISQTIQDASNTANRGTVQNFAGDPATANTATSKDGMRVNLEADGYGANINIDNFLQTADQDIVSFAGTSTAALAENRINEMYFSALARDDGYDAAEIEFDPEGVHEQSIVQDIQNSGGNVALRNTAWAELQAGFEANVISPTTGDDTISDNPVNGLLDVDNLDQTINQDISDVYSTSTTTANSFNRGDSRVLLLSQDGDSQFYVDGFTQYLDQTVDGCTNCGNIGFVDAVFTVRDAATFNLQEGSIQGLTQYNSENGQILDNTVSAIINVAGDGTYADIFYDQQILNYNGEEQEYTPYGYSAGSGTSDFSANINTGDYEQIDVQIRDNGYYKCAGYGSNAVPTPPGGSRTALSC